MLETNYTDDEEAQVLQEVDGLRVCWTDFVEEKQNGADLDIHEPPAVIIGATKILDSYIEDGLPPSTDGLFFTLKVNDMISFASMMFTFGQYAAEKGVVANTMLPCRCGRVTDEDIAELENKKNVN